LARFESDAAKSAVARFKPKREQAQGLSWEQRLLQRRLERQRLGRRVTMYEAFMRKMAAHHTLFALTCQPLPQAGTFHTIDIEQLLQCFWCSVVWQLAILGGLARAQGGDGHMLTQGQLVLDAAVAALASSIIGLVGVRYAFTVTGVASRSRNLGGDYSEEKWVDSGFVGIYRPPNEFIQRAVRAAGGWEVAFGVYLAGCITSLYFIAGATLAKFVSLLGAWGATLLISWFLVEPSLIALVTFKAEILLRCVYPCWQWTRRVFFRSQTKPSEDGGDGGAAVGRKKAVIRPLELAASSSSSSSPAGEDSGALGVIEMEGAPTKPKRRGGSPFSLLVGRRAGGKGGKPSRRHVVVPREDEEEETTQQPPPAAAAATAASDPPPPASVDQRPPPAELIATFGPGPMGIDLAEDGSVAGVAAGSAAQRQGVRAGTVVAEVNGEPTGGLDKAGVIARVAAAGRPLTMKFVRAETAAEP
jgi:hypothetical protein